MKIAVLSDIHDHIENLEKVLDEIKGEVKSRTERGSGARVDAIIYCGDMCAPFTTGILASAGIKTYACLGNVDEDHIMMQKKAGDTIEWFGLAKEFGEVELDGRKIAFNHYPRLAELQAGSDEYDAVFHGHTHVSRNEKVGKTLLVNPGAVCGIQKGRPGTASYAIYDTDKNSAEVIEIN